MKCRSTAVIVVVAIYVLYFTYLLFSVVIFIFYNDLKESFSLVVILTVLSFVVYASVLLLNIGTFNLYSSLSFVCVYGVTNVYTGVLVFFFSPFLSHSEAFVDFDEFYSPVHVEDYGESSNQMFLRIESTHKVAHQYTLPAVYNNSL